MTKSPALSENWKALQKQLKASSSSPSPSTSESAGIKSETAAKPHTQTPTKSTKSRSKPKVKNAELSKVGKQQNQQQRSKSQSTKTKPASNNSKPKSLPASSSSSHQSVLYQKLLNLDNTTPKGKDALARPGTHIALDCEFVGSRIGPGVTEESVLARVSIVNYFGTVLMDDFVKPRKGQRITDFRTWVSGVTAKDVLYNPDALDFDQAVTKVADLLKGRVLVGHALSNDLGVLGLSHSRSMIRDTSRHASFKAKLGVKGGHPVGLKRLSKVLLEVDIQSGQHSSVEDARAAMLLYRKYKIEFD